MKKILYSLLLLIAIVYFFPILYTFANSYMKYYQILNNKISLLPEEFNLEQYFLLITTKAQYFKFFFNSIKITITIILGQIIIGVFAAFAFAKIKFIGRNIIFIIYVLAILLPFQVTLVPNYLIFDKIENMLEIQIFDTHLSIIMPGIFSSFGVFLLTQFIKNIPNEIIESSKIDGAGYFSILFKIIIPLIKPALFTLVILTFIDNWNLVEQAIIFIDTPSKLPLSVYLESIFYNDHKVFYAGAVLYIIPAILIFIKGEKFLNEGLMNGGLK